MGKPNQEHYNENMLALVLNEEGVGSYERVNDIILERKSMRIARDLARVERDAALFNLHKLEALLRSIVTDVDAMRTEAPDSVQWNEESPEASRHWFGGEDFGEWQWPNLSILCEQAKQLLNKKGDK